MAVRTYYKLKYILQSPLSIGGGGNEKTDSDVVLDSRGKPFIPATAIAGVLRSWSAMAERRDAGCIGGNAKRERLTKTDALFGYVTGSSDSESENSRLRFYDAELATVAGQSAKHAGKLSVRDGVKLDEYKTAEKSAKYDFQIVESGTVFIGYVEAMDGTASEDFEKLLRPEIVIGSKATRGYGRVKVEYQSKAFDLGEQSGISDWLDFDMFAWDGGSVWRKPEREYAEENAVTIELDLQQKDSGLSIRQYYTMPGDVDYGPLALADGNPVIPGTSWAGCFKHRMDEFAPDKTKSVFGYVDERSKEAQKSRVSFGESVLVGCRSKRLVRNAIDRFTNGTKDHALYEEKTVYGGSTKLCIRIDSAVDAPSRKALCAVIMDLHNGFAAVGGLTGVGRGLFEVTSISVNGKSVGVDYGSLAEEVCNA